MRDASSHGKEKIQNRSRARDQTRIEELRSLILEPTDRQIEQLQSRLEDPEQRATDVSQVLHRAVSLGATRDDRLATALTPLTEKAIRDSIQKDRQVFVDALFPVMGPAIRKAIASTLQGLIQNFNQILEYSFSAKGLRWRLEAMRTRRPFGEVVLLHTLVYQVEQVFLIHRKSGLLIEHVVAKTAEAQNPDMVSGMLTAIKDFVHDSFGAVQGDTLDTFQVGRRRIWIEHGSHAMLAIVISGNPSIHLKEMMRDVLDDIQVSHAELLKGFSGDTTAFQETRPTLSGLLQVQFKNNEDKKSYGAWIVLGLVLLLVGWAVLQGYSEQQRWSRFVKGLHNQPGMVVTAMEEQGGKHHVYGLKDIYAPDPLTLGSSSQIMSEDVVFHWEPYQSAHPDYVRQRIGHLFKPPATIDLVFEKGVLTVTGAALQQWIDDARQLVRIVPWIDDFQEAAVINLDVVLERPDTVSFSILEQTLHAHGNASRQWITKARGAAGGIDAISAYDDSQLVDADAQEWESAAQAINASVFYFERGANTLVPGQRAKVRAFIKTAERLIALSDLLNRPAKIDIIGHADQAGSEAYNSLISGKRAQAFADLLSGSDVEKIFLTIHAAGSDKPIEPNYGAPNRAANRRVTFAVRSAKP